MEPNEKQYQIHFDDFATKGPVELGPMLSDTWRNDPKRLGIKLSRYKVVSKLLSGKKSVLEVGCGDGWASKLVCREVYEFYASDFDPIWRQHVEYALFNEANFKGFSILNPLTETMGRKFNALYALDVLEHIEPVDEPKFILNCMRMIDDDGICIFGMPSLESQIYASEGSRRGHVNCQSGEGLKSNLQNYFENVLVLSFNDEILHTGYYPMSHYLLAICFDKKDYRLPEVRNY